ncbi:hypothetical protein AB7W40_21200, partial [Providencia rettgeri]
RQMIIYRLWRMKTPSEKCPNFVVQNTGTAHNMMTILSATLLKYEPRIKSLSLVLLPQNSFGALHYALEVELHEQGLIRYGTEFMPDGRILVHHLKKQFDTI